MAVKKLIVDIEPDLHTDLKKMAIDRGMYLKALVTTILADYVRRSKAALKRKEQSANDSV